MKILHLSTDDISGGAAIAAYRIHKGLQKIGTDSKMLVQTKLSDDRTVISPGTKVKKGLALLRPTLDLTFFHTFPPCLRIDKLCKFHQASSTDL